MVSNWSVWASGSTPVKGDTSGGWHSWYVRNTHRISELRTSSPLRIMSKPEKLRIKVLSREVDCVLCTAYCILRTWPSGELRIAYYAPDCEVDCVLRIAYCVLRN